MPNSFYSVFAETAGSAPDKTAVLTKDTGRWREVSWGDLEEVVEAVGAGLVELGVGAGDRVSIFSNTRLEWAQADFGILRAAAVTVPIYQSNTPEEALYILQDSGAELVFVEDAAQLAKLRQIRADLPQVRKVISFDGDGDSVDAAGGWEMRWEDFLALGRSCKEARRKEVKERLAKVEPSSLATLIYTSGTTGVPKGVMVTHDNLLFSGQVIIDLGTVSGHDLQLLFLPMAHSFAKILVVTWVQTRTILAIAESLEKVAENMRDVRPTKMASVPRLFEKVHSRVVETATSQPGLAGRLAAWAFAQAQVAAQREDAGQRPGGLAWWLARKLVFAKVGRRLRESFGGCLDFFISGGAPLARDIAYFFRYAGVEICEGYGLTETSSVATVNPSGGVRIGTVGQALGSGVEIRLADDGEILIRGRMIFAGYWNQPEATAEVLSEDGWFRTGDIGHLDEDGYLSITDRKKDLIITAGGKNIAPQYLENLLKSRSPLISQAVVYGDRKPYLVALVTLDEGALQEWAGRHGKSGSHRELTRLPEIEALVEAEKKAVNAQLPRYETLKYVAILDHDFTVGDQLTPTLKVRRKICNERYRDIFEGLYHDAETPAKEGDRS